MRLLPLLLLLSLSWSLLWLLKIGIIPCGSSRSSNSSRSCTRSSSSSSSCEGQGCDHLASPGCCAVRAIRENDGKQVNICLSCFAMPENDKRGCGGMLLIVPHIFLYQARDFLRLETLKVEPLGFARRGILWKCDEWLPPCRTKGVRIIRNGRG